MKVRDLTPLQIQALIIAADFVLAGEWDETINAAQKLALERAREKLGTALAKTQEGAA